MALDTYDNLKLEIIDWSHREDIDLKVDTFIDMAETEMFNNPQEVLKVRGQETLSSTTTSTTVRTQALPTGYQSMRSISLTFGDVTTGVVYRAPEQLLRINRTGLPCFFTVTDQIEYDRVPDVGYTSDVQHLALPTPLSSSNQTNTVLTNNPSIYLFGALWALFEYAEQEDVSQKYYLRFINAIRGANKQFRDGRYGPAPAMRVEGPTP
jgi:hypothetical protein